MTIFKYIFNLYLKWNQNGDWFSQQNQPCSNSCACCNFATFFNISKLKCRFKYSKKTVWRTVISLPPSTLTLSLHSWNISFAYRLNEMNIWLKFNENPSRHKGDMEQTGNQRLKLVIFNCDLDFELAWLSYGFCTSSHWDNTFNQILMKILPGVKEIWTQYSRLNPMTFNCNLDLEFAWLSNEFTILSHWGKHLTKVKWKSFQG